MATVTRRLAALLGASGAGLTDSATSSQITTTSLKDDAVTSAKIGTDQVGADALSSSAIAGAADIPANSVGESELSIDLSAQSVPHIIPDVLYPSYVASGTSNKLLDGTTDHSGAFGTLQADGRKYYYTNIAGSKPIKDPRIGVHFGSQRHMFKSIQILEQETAIHGDDVYSIDGREWMRGVGNLELVYDTRTIQLKLESATTSFFEITGYFSAFNFLNFSSDSVRNLKVELDGVTAHATFNPNGAENSPLGSRYVSAGSVFNVPLTASGSSLSSDTTLGIHTIRISWVSGTNYPTGCELIAQDTASTARRSEIKIPKQNVVSFGKKFEVGSDDLDNAVHPHYDPFTTMSYGGSGTTLSNLQSLIDKDTSLGLDNWKAGTSNYHRPWNGGRVVKWVDNSGTIKTSVTMMTPNAQNIGTTASSDGNNGDAVTGDQIVAGTNDDTINFNTSAIDHSLSEVAKAFYFREFGNGAANGGTGGNYADASMLKDATDDIAYVMDDGLTSLTAKNAVAHTSTSTGLAVDAVNDFIFLTFIGTGFSLRQIRTANTPNDQFTITVDGVQVKTGQVFSGTDEFHIVQNLPYGTHVVKLHKTFSNYITHITEFTFYQPKRPPIPEDACVLADYMLMADFVSQTTGGIGLISKGVRSNSVSRDVFSNIPSSAAFDLMYPKTNQHHGFRISTNSTGSSDTDHTFRLPSFGTTYLVRAYNFDDRHKLFVDTTEKTHTHHGTDYESFGRLSTALDLGVHKFGVNAKQNKNPNISAFEVATPIHTSHHYQPFETPFLHELVGGDRNMEQHNLVCSPDGKTWDELTRNTSYIGNIVLQTEKDDRDLDASTVIIYDEWRGIGSNVAFDSGGSNARSLMNKGSFAIAYDRIICLKDGDYEIFASSFISQDMSGSQWGGISINGEVHTSAYYYDTNFNQIPINLVVHLKRGDYIQHFGAVWEHGFGGLSIKKI